MSCRLVHREFYLEAYDFVGNRENPKWERTSKLKQSKVRRILERDYEITSEEMVKYVYDLYTWKVGVKPIRKKKTRSKVKDEFNGSVKQAYFLMYKIIEIHNKEFKMTYLNQCDVRRNRCNGYH